MAKLLYEEDGFKLMLLLRKETDLLDFEDEDEERRNETRLLTLQYKGRNALHLAMRHNWYGLLEEILYQFEHLENGEDLFGRRKPEGSKSTRLLDVNLLRDLVTCKEGTSDTGSSGLDVLAMAVIQCHQKINTLLVGCLSLITDLFEGHTYQGVVSSGTRLEIDTSGWQGDTWEGRYERKSHHRKLLSEVLGEFFPNLSGSLKLNRAPIRNMNSIEYYQIDPDPDIHMWMLTNPFLPFAEHLILDFCCNWGKHETLLSRLSSTSGYYTDRIMNIDDSSRVGIEGYDFCHYLLGISDTRRTVLHYAALNSSRALRKSEVHPFLAAVDRDWSYYSQMRDSSGRTVGHLLVALEPPPLRDDHPLFDFRIFENLSNWDPLGREDWVLDLNTRCSIKIESVHTANDYAYYGNPIPTEFRSLSLEQIIFTSPHTTATGQMKWMKFIRDFEVSCNVNSVRPSVHAGVTSDLPLTPLHQYVLMGFNTLVKEVAQNDQYYDTGRIKNQLEPELVSFWLERNTKPEVGSDHEAEVGSDHESALGSNHESALGFDHEPVVLSSWSESNTEPEVISSWSKPKGVRWKSALQLAAERADPGILRILLGTGKFDAHFEDGEGNTLLHSAACSEDVTVIPFILTDFLEVPEGSSEKLPGMEQSLKAKNQQSEMEERRQLESRRRGCVNLLLQEGLDIWETNNSGKIADPGLTASTDYTSWWYEKLTRVTQDQKSSFSGTATAISVTGVLVAAASYVGPLQPPLGYSSEDVDQIAKAQAGLLPVHVFFACNTLAFYLAVAAVVLSLTPSIPMLHESTSEELKRIRRCVTWALLLLIIALVAVLSAFASASVVVIPNGGKWNDGGITASGVVVGCIVCLALLILCCARAVKLVFHNNSAVDRFYRKWVCI